MTGIIRSTRLATERKMLPVVPAVVEARKAQAAAPAAPQPGSAQERSQQHGVPGQPPVQQPGQPLAQQSPTQQDPQGAAQHSRPAAPVTLTYEEYKQRVSTELNELRKQVLDSSREQGLKEGLQQGRLAAETEYRKQLDTLRNLIASAREAREQYLHDLADDAAEIVWVAVGKILGEGFANKSAAVAAVQETLRRSKERGRLRVRVAPQDFQLLEARRREWLDGVSASDVELVSDEQVKLGGCLLDGASGNLDGRLETQLQRLRAALVQARSQWSEPLE
jgi:flagellar assembly protein FliH